MRRRVLLPVLAVLALWSPAVASAQEAPPAEPQFVELCTPTDPALSELSGMTVLDGSLYAMGDSGADERIAQVDMSTCAVQQWIPNPVDPYDVEDLSHRGNALWLADIGDNDAARPTIALVRAEGGGGELRRLTYPDGAHDAEAVLIGSDGAPVIVTKEFDGRSGVYSVDNPIETLDSPGPTQLQRVGDVTLTATTTSGGPPLIAGSLLITGGAVSMDGTVAALRTYTDVYLYSAPDGDIVSALASGPSRQIALPAQPQGEAVAFTDNGDLLFASEAGFVPTATLPPIGVLKNATALVAPRSSSTESASSSLPWGWIGGGAAALAIVVLGVVVSRRRRPWNS